MNAAASADGQLYRTPVGFRLDLRHRIAWRLADAARWLTGEAAVLQERAHDLSRGEISPILPILLNQLDDLARGMGTDPSKICRQIEEADPSFWARGRRPTPRH